jgi:hypothetical protein
MRLGWLAGGAALALACSFVRPALADSTDSGAAMRQAKALFDDARLLVKSGYYLQACPKFERSLQLNAAFGTEFNLADCVEHLGQTNRARALYLDVADKTHAVGQTDREQLARERAAALDLPATEPVAAVAEVRPVVIVEHGSKENPRPELECAETASLALEEEYGSLADATAHLRTLEQSAAALTRSAPRDPHLRALKTELVALEKELGDAWALAGGVATQLERRARHSPTPVAPPANALSASR